MFIITTYKSWDDPPSGTNKSHLHHPYQPRPSDIAATSVNEGIGRCQSLKICPGKGGVRTPGWKINLPETNSKGPENKAFWKGNTSIPSIHFQGAMLSGKLTAVFHKVMEVDGSDGAIFRLQPWIFRGGFMRLHGAGGHPCQKKSLEADPPSKETTPTWNPNDLYFWRSTPQNKAVWFQPKQGAPFGSQVTTFFLKEGLWEWHYIYFWLRVGDTLRDHLTARDCWKMGAPDWVDVFPVKNGEIAASYVSLPGGNDYNPLLGGGFKYFLFSPLLREDSHFD